MTLNVLQTPPAEGKEKRTHYLFIDAISSNKSILTCTLGAFFFFFLRENNFHYLKNCLHVFSSKKEDKICIATTEG